MLEIEIPLFTTTQTFVSIQKSSKYLYMYKTWRIDAWLENILKKGYVEGR
jgi:hypothetical protein